MRLIMLACFAVFAVLSLMTNHVRAEEQENPYKKADVGDWMEWKMSMMGQEATTKQTVKAKDDTSVTLTVETKMMGQTQTQEHKIDLTKPFDPNKPQQDIPNAKVEIVEKGNETIKVGDKEYKCNWTKVKVTMDVQGNTIESNAKTYVCPDVPLGGMVKVETEAMGMKTSMEMTGHGKGASK